MIDRYFNFITEFVRFRSLERPDYDGSRWSDLIMCFYFIPMIALVKYFSKISSEGFFRRRLSLKYQGEALELKVKKSVRNFFKIIYFSFVTILGFYVYSD